MLEPLQTNDQSFTLFHPVLNESYHSRKGALTESLHVFIQHGLLPVSERKTPVRLLEVGFGTGLNAYLTYLQSIKNEETQLEYIGLEPFPLPFDLVEKLHFNQHLPNLSQGLDFNTFYQNIIEKSFHTSDLLFNISHKGLFEFTTTEGFNLIYYDAFAPHAQPDLWTFEAMEKLSELAKPEAILVTYCAQSQFKRNLKACGWTIERLPGPPGKREMTRATYLPPS
jgi:tRNA U34 5-methylaminomethyl-2-thiouridine-forming methyltransferase MnmC